MEYLEDDELDNEWAEEMIKENQEYDCLYNVVNDYISLFLIYINKKNQIIFVKKENYQTNNGVISKLDLSIILKKNLKYNNKKYAPLSLLKYNIDLEPDNVNNYLDSEKDFKFFSVEKNIKDLKWNNSIELFKDINSLYIVFYEKQERKKQFKTTKSIFLKNLKKNKTRKLKRT